MAILDIDSSEEFLFALAIVDVSPECDEDSTDTFENYSSPDGDILIKEDKSADGIKNHECEEENGNPGENNHRVIREREMYARFHFFFFPIAEEEEKKKCKKCEDDIPDVSGMETESIALYSIIHYREPVPEERKQRNNQPNSDDP